MKTAIQKAGILFLLLFCSVLSAGEKKTALVLDFSAQPEAGDAFLCNFSIREKHSYTMKMKGKAQPARSDTTVCSLSGFLTFTSSSSGSFRLDSFRQQENGVPQQSPPALSGKKINFSNGEFALAEAEQNVPFFPNENAGTVRELPSALKKALSGMIAFLQNRNSNIFGAPRSAAPEETWTVPAAFTGMLAENRGVNPDFVQWFTQIKFRGLRKYLDIPAAVLELEVISKPLAGFDCKLSAVYRFPVPGAPALPLSADLEWSEVIDKNIPDNNPVFSGTNFTETRVMTVNASFLPVKN